MTLLDRLQEDVKRALKQGDKARVAALRLVVADLKRAAIDGGGGLDEAAELKVLRRALKQRQEAAEAFRGAGREESAAGEEAEAALLQGYLPAQLEGEALERVVREAIAEVGATSARDLGRVMGVLMSRHRDELDGRAARDVAGRLLAGD